MTSEVIKKQLEAKAAAEREAAINDLFVKVEALSKKVDLLFEIVKGKDPGKVGK